MYEDERKKLEQACLNNIKSNDRRNFELNYNLLMTLNVSPPLLKAYMLLLLLSQKREKDYYKLMQTVSIEDMEDEFIKMVMFVERSTITGNLKRLDNLKKTCKYAEFVPLLVEIYNINKNSIVEDYSEKLSSAKRDVHTEQTVKDSLFIALHAYNL